MHDDRVFFEFLILEGAQAGLSWDTILRKRDRYRVLFEEFDPERVAHFGTADVDRIVADAGIVRHRGKVESAVSNARAFLQLQEREGSFDAWAWRFVGGSPRRNAWTSSKEIPASTPASVALSRELKRRGFRFVGPTICYAFMQATGLVNDHEAECFRSLTL